LLQTSPIIRFALEVFQHALENYCSDQPRTRKMAVLSMAQALELALKAALVEKNVPIFEKNGRTINHHDALAQVAKIWSVDRIDNQTRVELLIDERNALQHRYGTVDDVALDYHMQTSFDVLSDIMQKEFDTELAGWIRDNVAQEVWEKVRFVTDEEASDTPSDAVIENRSPVLDLVDGFSRYESRLREVLASILGEEDRFTGSTLDVVMKTLSNVDEPNEALIKRVPDAYKLRNQVIHGNQEADEAMVRASLRTLDEVLDVVRQAPSDTLVKALVASRKGIKGTKIKWTIRTAGDGHGGPDKVFEIPEVAAAEPAG